MGADYLTNPLVFLIETLFDLYVLAVMLRFLLQWVHADFYNPLSQFIVRVTAPPLRPLRRLIPGTAGLDLASLVLAWGVKSVELMLVLLVIGRGGQALGALLWSLPELLALVLNIFLFAILIQAVLSWVQGGYHPLAGLLDRLTAPVLVPARRLLPPMSGLDLSPMVAMIAIVLLKMLLLPPLKALTGSPF